MKKVFVAANGRLNGDGATNPARWRPFCSSLTGFAVVKLVIQ